MAVDDVLHEQIDRVALQRPDDNADGSLHLVAAGTLAIILSNIAMAGSARELLRFPD